MEIVALISQRQLLVVGTSTFEGNRKETGKMRPALEAKGFY